MKLKDNKEIYSSIQSKEIHVTAYLLDQVESNLMDVYKKNCPFVEIKEFNYTKYPEYFKILMHYRWKLLIVAEELEKHDVVFWFDTSIVFTNGTQTLKVKL